MKLFGLLFFRRQKLTEDTAYANLGVTMVHHNTTSKKTLKLSPLLAAAAMVVSSIIAPVVARADQFDDQINAIKQQQNVNQQSANVLGAQANDVQSQINDLQNQIAAIQAQIDINTARQNDLQNQIDAAQKKLDEQKSMLSANIRAMYIEGDISPLEMIASSKNLSDFVDKQEYRDRIKDSISGTMDEIERLKKQLNDQKVEVAKILDDQKSLRASLDQKNADAGAKLASINQDKASFDAQIKQQSGQIAGLKAQQRAANARLGGSAVAGDPAKGGYPSRWASAPQDSLVDSWGMYNRECVSYTAWKVYQSGRTMPYWGGRGNANQWPANARAAGIAVDGNPQVGDVAISMSGAYGHAMYVEAVSGGKVYVSQYNYSINGEYSEMWTNASGLYFIHF
jgi:peptidoglycan hydrolase CwlO-like protein